MIYQMWIVQWQFTSICCASDPPLTRKISPQANTGPPFAPLSPAFTAIPDLSLFKHVHTQRSLSASRPAQSDSHWVNIQGAKGWLS